MATFTVNETKPAYAIGYRPWAGLIGSPATLNVSKLNEQSMVDYPIYDRNLSVRDWRRERGIPEIKDPLDAFRVTVKMSIADDFLLPQRPSIGDAAKAAAKKQGRDEQMAEAAAQQAVASFDALVETMRKHGDFEYTLDRYLHVLPEQGNAMGQRVLYLGDSKGEKDADSGGWIEGAEVHDLKRLLVNLAKDGCMLDKNNVWVLYYPGGKPQQLLEKHGMTHGVSHGGRISLAWNSHLDRVLGLGNTSSTNLGNRELDPAQISGEKTDVYPRVAADPGMDLPGQILDKLKMLWYDQPASYGGNPTTYTVSYGHAVPVWWCLTIFDPSTIEWGGREAQGGAVQPDADVFRAWAENTEMWSALDVITVPYPHDQEEAKAYERNPVEIKKATDLVPYANNILIAACSPKGSEGKESALNVLYGYAEYCEEGKVNVKNVGLCVPLNQRSVEEGRIDKEAFNRFEKMADFFKSKTPEEAWMLLLEENYISQEQLEFLQMRGYIHQRLRVLDDSVWPWTDYRPKGVETDPQEDGYGLYTRPITPVTLTAHYMASNFPREELTKGFLKGVRKVLDLGENSAARQSLIALAQAQGLMEVNAEAIAKMFTIGFVGKFLEVSRPKLLDKLRHEKMDANDKENVEKYLDKFQALAVNPTLDRDTLVVEIKKLNDEFRDVKFPSLKGKMGQTIENLEPRALQFYSPLQGVECPKGAPFMSEMVGHHHLAFMMNARYRK